MDQSADLNAELTDGYVIVKGFIDARDAQSRSVYGAFVSASSHQKTEYLRLLFTLAPIDKEMPWSRLIEFLSSDAASPSDPELAQYTDSLSAHFRIHRILEKGRAHLDAKDLERKISAYCSQSLGLSAVAFVDVSEVDERELLELIPDVFAPAEEPEVEWGTSDKTGGEPEGEPSGESAGGSSKEPEEIYLACDPVLDAMNGAAASSLVLGDAIDVKLPPDSMYFAFMKQNDPGFRGIASAEVMGVKLDEYGAAVVALRIAEGVSGALRISESVKLKRSERRSDFVTFGARTTSPELILAAFGIAVFLVLIAVFLYIF